MQSFKDCAKVLQYWQGRADIKLSGQFLLLTPKMFIWVKRYRHNYSHCAVATKSWVQQKTVAECDSLIAEIDKKLILLERE